MENNILDEEGEEEPKKIILTLSHRPRNTKMHAFFDHHTSAIRALRC
jgi:hypothetical protein